MVLIRSAMVVQVAIKKVLQNKRCKNRELQMPQFMAVDAAFLAQNEWFH